MAKLYGDQGWPARVEDQAFTYDYSAPSAGPPPWYLYEVTPTTVYGVLASGTGGATALALRRLGVVGDRWRERMGVEPTARRRAPRHRC